MSEASRAVFYMLFSAASFAAMGAFVKAAAELPVLERVIVRNLVTLVVAGLIAGLTGRPLLGRLAHQPLLFTRSLLGLAGVTCYFYAIDHLILADAAMLTKLSPFFVAIFAFLFLRERLSSSLVVALCAAFLGGLCIVKPRFDLTVLPALVGLSSSIFAGGAYTAVRSLRTREFPETIIFHFSLVTVAGLLPVAWPQLRLPNQVELWWLLGIGVCAAGGQFGLTLAYRHAPAAQVSVYSYTTIAFSAVLGFMLWGEVPDPLSVVGGVLIAAGGILSFVSERRTAKREVPSKS